MKSLDCVFVLTFFQLSCMEAIPAPDGSSSSASRLLLLDVDNTLYREADACVEAQIVEGTHSYCQDILAMDKEEADELYRQFGSTVEGLQKTIWKDLSDAELEDRLEGFYRAVYDNVDPSSILLPDSDADSGSTGYSHASKEERKLARQLLKCSPLPIALASNSPSWHVHKVLRALGLEKLGKGCDTFTPDRLPTYPTKNQPEEFFSVNGWGWGSSLSKYGSVSFLDDSLYNLKKVKQTYPLLIDRIHQVNRMVESNDCSSENGEENLVQALLQDFGLIDPAFDLSQTKYLESKNAVDRRSLHAATWNTVMNELQELIQTDTSDIWIADLGAGLLSMLDLLLHGDENLGLSALFSSSRPPRVDSGSKTIHYTAYESNQELHESSHERLLSWGFEVVEKEAPNEDEESDIIEMEVSNEDEGADIVEKEASNEDEGVDTTEREASNEYEEPDKIEKEATNEDEVADIITYQKYQNGVTLRVQLILRDFSSVKKDELLGLSEKTPNVIIGCCFADLMDPEKLVPDLLRSFGLLGSPTSLQKRTLIYFPITFTGTTQFLPPQPFEFQSSEKDIPSDTVGFQSYSRALEEVLGHNLNPFLLQEALEDHGANLIKFGSSDWKIDPERDSYLYETMLYFFGSTGGPQLLKEGWDAVGWIQRAHTNKPNIQVSNRDLLFCIEPTDNNNKISNKESENEGRLEEILFTAPLEVTSIEKNIPSELGPKQVLVRSSYSLISSGTELKIFKGLFDDDAALDVNIKDMEEERMAYPLSYGYCLVGVVVDCGSEVSREDFVGKTIFTFSPHASHVVTDADAVQIVPDGIDPEDAIFMPSVETALSLVHDANVRIGENIAVYGQGLIGLLVTALLSRGRSDGSGGKFDSVTTFDMIPDRLAASSKMGASQALIPGKNSEGVKFDVSIEVSGNARALQSAIDNTVNGGRVIVGSWYGNKDVSLKLGIDFHRSHKTIQTSQVSEIPAQLSQLWTKERRFAYTWELVKQLKPGRLLTKVLPLNCAQEAYKALDKGTEMAIAFDYRE